MCSVGRGNEKARGAFASRASVSRRWCDRQDVRATRPQPREVPRAEIQQQQIAAVELVTAPSLPEMPAPCQGLHGASIRSNQRRIAGAHVRDIRTAATRNAPAYHKPPSANRLALAIPGRVVEAQVTDIAEED